MFDSSLPYSYSSSLVAFRISDHETEGRNLSSLVVESRRSGLGDVLHATVLCRAVLFALPHRAVLSVLGMLGATSYR